MIFEYKDIKYDPVLDEQEVDQIGFIDLRKAWETHTIAGDFNIEDLNFNDLEDAEATYVSPRNVFEAVTMSHAIASAIETHEAPE